MSKYGSSSVAIYIENLPGTSTGSVNISQYVDELGGLKITSIMEPSHSFGDSWEEQTPVGMSRGEPFDIGGLYDNTASSDGGPHGVFKDIDNGTTDDGRGMVVNFGGGAFWHSDVRVASYEVLGANGKLTRWRANLIPTGTVSWTTSTS